MCSDREKQQKIMTTLFEQDINTINKLVQILIKKAPKPEHDLSEIQEFMKDIIFGLKSIEISLDDEENVSCGNCKLEHQLNLNEYKKKENEERIKKDQ